MFSHTEPKKSASCTTDFESVYLTYRNLMFHVAIDILHNNADAEDAVQLACIKIAENLDKIKEIHSAKTKGYIITIVENKAIDLYQQNTKQQHLEYSESYNALHIFTIHKQRLQ